MSKQFRLHINYLILSFLFSSWSWGGSELALSMVPRGKILEENGREILVKTAMGTKVTIEFHRNGGFQEASGKNLNQGDDLEPGDGLISLSTAALVIKGHAPEGYWTLEKDQILGWIYDFNLGIVDAKTGKILERKKILKNAQSF